MKQGNGNNAISSKDKITRKDNVEESTSESELKPTEPLFRSAELYVREPTLLLHHSQSLDTPFKHDATLLKYHHHAKPKKFAKKQTAAKLEDLKRPTWTSRIPKRIGMFNQVSNYCVEVDRRYLDAVLESLVEVFRIYSLEVIYQDAPTLSAKCRTCLEKLEFVVFIWQSRDANKILVEVHRVFGDSVPFHAIYSNVIIDTVQGAEASSSEQPLVPNDAVRDPIMRGTSDEEKSYLEAISSLLNQFRKEAEISSSENSTQSVIDVIYKLIASQRYDSLGMALESLIQLTSAATSGLDVAKEVSTIVLLGRSNDDMVNGSDEMSMRYIHERVLHLAITGRCMDNDWFHASELSDHSLAALVVIAQTVNNVDTSDLCSFITSAESLLPEPGLIDLLFEKIEKADEALHVAYLASHILSVLSSNRLTEATSKVPLHIDDIERAYRIGSSRHAGLEVSCTRLLNTIDCS